MNGVGMKKEAKPAQANQETYICFHSGMGSLVHDYINKRLGAQEENLFAAHLLLCLECQEVVLEWEEIFQAASNPQRKSVASQLRVTQASGR